MDRISFLPYTLPPEIKTMASVLPRIEQSAFRKILVKVVDYLKGEEITKEDIKNIEAACKLTEHSVAVIFTGLFYVLRLAIRQKTKSAHVTIDLKETNIPVNFIEDIVQVLDKSRQFFEEAGANNIIKLPTVEDLRWRLDVIISTSSLSRALQTSSIRSVLMEVNFKKNSIHMELTTSEGDIKQFEVDIDQFHALRYNVAKVLKEMEDIEQLPILKVGQ